MYLTRPHARNAKWTIRLRIHDNRVVKIPGDTDREAAWRIGERVKLLVRARQNGEHPPGELAEWIDNMPKVLSDRLVHLGLLTQRRLERYKPLKTHIVTYGRIVRRRKSNKLRHAQQQESKVRRICKAMRAKRFDDLTEQKLLDHLESAKIAVSTRRGFIIAMNDFASEMVRAGIAKENPFQHIQAPGQYEDPEYERQPLTVEQFRKVMAHLDTFERYKYQKARWTAYDRKIIYWTAVRTALRENEMMKLVRGNFYFDESPAIVCLKARHAKNKTEGEIAIPSDLARALKVYMVDIEPNDRVFPFPETSGSIVDMLRRDLTEAGIEWKLPTGEVMDFHSLRSTCITWWLDEDGLKPKRVQVLARLKTLALVYNYSRNLRLDDFSWLDNGPKLVPAPTRRKAG